MRLVHVLFLILLLLPSLLSDQPAPTQSRSRPKQLPSKFSRERAGEAEINLGPRLSTEEEKKEKKRGKERTKKKNHKAIYRPTEVLRPSPYVLSEDPNHPNMRTYYPRGQEHTANLMPENTFFKDHDSEKDESDPWKEFNRVADMDSKEHEQEIWNKLEENGADIRRWLDDGEYHKTIDKYGLQDITKFKHLCPPMWFELPGSSDDEEQLDRALCMPSDDEVQPPTVDEPFCMKCQSLLGMRDINLGLEEDPTDPKCRSCGYLNPAGPDGMLLNGARSTFLHFGASQKLQGLQEDQIDEMLKEDSDVADQLHNFEEHRPQMEEKCDECGYTKAYYWSAQVRSMDEGQTTFFECVRCGHVWSIK